MKTAEIFCPIATEDFDTSKLPVISDFPYYVDNLALAWHAGTIIACSGFDGIAAKELTHCWRLDWVNNISTGNLVLSLSSLLGHFL